MNETSGTKPENNDLATASFWDNRYANAKSVENGDDDGQPTHEWFKSFESLRPFFRRWLLEHDDRRPQMNPCVLHLGCGDSTLPADLDAEGYTHQKCIDFSAVVIERMSTLHADKAGRITWHVADVRDMSASVVADESVDAAVDKGTLDAMIKGSPWDPPEEVRTNIRRYLDEVVRILKPGGVFLYITFRQPHFMKPLLNREGVWSLSVEELNDEQGSFGYFGYVMEKKRSQ